MQIQTLPWANKTADFLPLLKKTTLFHGLSTAELNEVSQATSLQRYPKESFVFHRDEPANCVYILASGVMHLSQLTTKGQQVIMHYLSPGDEIGIVGLFPDQVFPVTAVAATDCLMLSWSTEKLTALIKRFPQVALNALQMMTERFVTLQHQYRQLATERVEQRIARTVLRIAEKTGQPVKSGILLKPPLSRQKIAEMTGTTLFTVSRICSQWEKDGIVQTNRRWLLIQNMSDLNAIVEDPIGPMT